MRQVSCLVDRVDYMSVFVTRPFNVYLLVPLLFGIGCQIQKRTGVSLSRPRDTARQECRKRVGRRKSSVNARTGCFADLRPALGSHAVAADLGATATNVGPHAQGPLLKPVTNELYANNGRFPE